MSHLSKNWNVPSAAWRGMRTAAALTLMLGGVAAATSAPARAVVIELKDVASDRVERQRAEAIGQLPLPDTPNVGQLAERLAEKHMAIGSPILIRVFKASSELELWMRTGDRYELFATYPICNWSGTLGPKLLEGDKQSPEGVYTVASQQLHLVGRHPRSLNLGFPNALDRQMNRTGSYILIHGGCSSVGCFAMTNPVIEEVYSLSLAALSSGHQDAIQVHVYPFRMTEEHLQAYAGNEWYDFWRNLKDASDSFERTHQPPRITICEGRYWVEDGTATEEVASHGPLAVCAVSLAEAASSPEPGDANRQLSQPWWPQRAMLPPALVPSLPSAPMAHSPKSNVIVTARSFRPFASPRMTAATPIGPEPVPAATRAMLAMTSLARTGRFATDPVTSPAKDMGIHGLLTRPSSVTPAVTLPCSPVLPSCRHWVATHWAALHPTPGKGRRIVSQGHGTGRPASRHL